MPLTLHPNLVNRKALAAGFLRENVVRRHRRLAPCRSLTWSPRRAERRKRCRYWRPGHCRAGRAGSSTSTDRKPRRSWRRCVVARNAAVRSPRELGATRSSAAWDWKARSPPRPPQKSRKRLSPFTSRRRGVGRPRTSTSTSHGGGRRDDAASHWTVMWTRWRRLRAGSPRHGDALVQGVAVSTGAATHSPWAASQITSHAGEPCASRRGG